MIVVVSPHLDDAVLSCGGILALAARRRERAVVVTVFTEGYEHERRRAEDRQALEILGAQPIHLGLSDAPERLGLARTHAALVEDARVDPVDLATVRAAMEDALASLEPIATLLAPLGVGGHVDHSTVHAALRDREGASFYEDRPYAFVPGAVAARLVEARISSSEGGPAIEPVTPGSTIADASAVLPHLSLFLGSEPRARARSLRWLEARYASPRPDPSFVERMRHLRIHPLDDASLDLAARAASAYSSQGRLLPLLPLPRLERTYDPEPSAVR